MEVAADQRCNFLGNVTVGKDVALATLQQLYHAVRLSSNESNMQADPVAQAAVAQAAMHTSKLWGSLP